MMRMFIAVAVMALAVPGAAQPPTAETTLGDQVDLSLTAYNNGFALVRDVRKLAGLPTGDLQLRFTGVAAQIRPETVHLKSISASGSVAVLEQNYEYDLMTPAKMLEKYVGKPVKLVNFDKKIGFTEVDAELVSVNQGPVYKVGDQIRLDQPGGVVLPEIPPDLIAKPSLVWTVNNQTPEQKIEASYITGGVSWKADYVLTLAKDEKSLGIFGWVTLTNQSGATFDNAQLKVVAGEVNLAPKEAIMETESSVALGMAYFADAVAKEETFAEYHLYTIPHRTTIKQNQSKQVALLTASGVKCAKKYEYRGLEYFYSQPTPQRIENERIDVLLEFKNAEANKLGLPLPAGVMRIYQNDSDGSAQFAGEDRVEHTPKAETVRLRMGAAFDIVGERAQKDYQQIDTNVHDSSYEIVVRNHKTSDIAVEVIEPMPGDWRILKSSQPFAKKDARTALFKLAVPKDGEAKVWYRVRVTL